MSKDKTISKEKPVKVKPAKEKALLKFSYKALDDTGKKVSGTEMATSAGAAHVAQEVAPRVRQVVGIDLTPALLRLAAARLAATAAFISATLSRTRSVVMRNGSWRWIALRKRHMMPACTIAPEYRRAAKTNDSGLPRCP